MTIPFQNDLTLERSLYPIDGNYIYHCKCCGNSWLSSDKNERCKQCNCQRTTIYPKLSKDPKKLTEMYNIFAFDRLTTKENPDQATHFLEHILIQLRDLEGDSEEWIRQVWDIVKQLDPDFLLGWKPAEVGIEEK